MDHLQFNFNVGFKMDDDIISIIIIICVIILCFLIKGAIKTFKRHPVVAILCVIFLFPIYIIWAFIELFTLPIERKIFRECTRKE